MHQLPSSAPPLQPSPSTWPLSRLYASSTGDFVGLTPEVEAELRDAQEPEVSGAGGGARTSRAPAGELPDRAQVMAALAGADGRAVVAAERLGLRNRFVLYRLMKKYGLGDGGE